MNDVADAVIYEMHWRDFSAHATSPVQNKGKFLSLTEPEGIKQPELIALHKLAETAVLTSQGIPFIFCGEEVLRDKKGVHNSYNSPDSINAIDWTLKQQNLETYQYYADLIAMRKAHKAFHMGKAELVKANLSFIETPSGVVAYQINGAAVGDSWESIIVVLNANTKPAHKTIPLLCLR